VIAVSDLDNWVGLALGVLGILYLVAVLVHPERF
jgi:K+-transporting ATPase KdpF subunit